MKYYLWASYRRKILDKLLEENKRYYKGIVLDVGGRDRGKFVKPKDKVEKWIFADIEKKHNPDIILNVCNMDNIASESIDIISSMELFEHVENAQKGIEECYRVLKKGGVMIISMPFLYQVHADPYDFQRWTETKWKKELKKIGFSIEKFEIMGRFFTVWADMGKVLVKSMPSFVKFVLYLFYPLLDLVVMLDKFNFVKNHDKIGKFHGGYFIILNK